MRTHRDTKAQSTKKKKVTPKNNPYYDTHSCIPVKFHKLELHSMPFHNLHEQVNKAKTKRALKPMTKRFIGRTFI